MLTLQDILQPTPVSEWFDRMNRGEIAVLRGRQHLAELLTWSHLKDALGIHPLEHIRVTRQREDVPSAFFSEGGRASVPRIEKCMDVGASLIVSQLDVSRPFLRLFADAIRHDTSYRVQVYAVATSGEGGLFRPHYDYGNAIVFQIEGTKRWQLFGPQVPHPVAGMIQGSSGTELVLDTTLSPGDVLLLPGGYWHTCENGPGRSLHLALLAEPLSMVRVLRMLASRLHDDEAARRPVLHLGNGDTAAAEAGLKQQLASLIESLSLADLLDAHSRR